MTPAETMQVIKSKQDKMQTHREAWFKKGCNSAYHEQEIKTLRDELKELYLRVETTPEEQIKLITAEANGKEIEVLYKDQKEWKDKDDKSNWGFRNFYRVKPGQEETETTKPRYGKDTELSELMEGVIDRPAGFETTKPVPGEIVQLDFPEYIPVEPDSPEVKRRYAKVTPLILLMEKWAENEVDLQFKPKGDSEWSDVYGDPLWNFGDMEYQTVPKVKQPEPILKTIPLTDEEKEALPVMGKILKAKDSKALDLRYVDSWRVNEWESEYTLDDLYRDYYILNIEKMEWEDRSKNEN